MKKNKPKMMNEINKNMDNYVIMANLLLKGKSKLSVSQAKLLRLIIMQIKADDEEVSAFHINGKELSNILQLDGTNSARNFRKLCYELAEKVVKIETNNPKKPWKVIPWIGYIEYTDDGEVIVQLNSWLAPYLIGLKKSGNYTQYVLEHILSMNSIYSIRIYELLKLKLPNKIPRGGIKTFLSNQEIRQATETEKIYKRNSDYRKNVLDVATKEITKRTDIIVTYEQIRNNGRAYDTVEFLCSSRWDNGQELPIEVECKSKLIKMNSIRVNQGKQSIGLYNEIVGNKKFESVEEFDLFLIDYIQENNIK